MAAIIAVGFVAVIVAVGAVGRRFGVAPPLILVLVGVVASFLLKAPEISIPPQYILSGVLPPLLYSAALRLPIVEFRRDIVAIGGLSVLLVLITAIVVGIALHAIIPDLPFAYAIALGAIVSPTDAVATSIVKRLDVPPRVVTILDGEALLNDATALVLVRASLAAAAIGFSAGGITWAFLRSAAIAIAIGVAVGWLGIVVRQRVTDPAANTVVSFLVPFVASIPCEYLDASGLVAAVAAGIMTHRLAPYRLGARLRLAERTNWETVGFVLEGAVFGAMGLQLSGLLADVHRTHDRLSLAFGVGAATLALTLLVRGGFLAALLSLLHHSTQRMAQRGEWWKRAGTIRAEMARGTPAETTGPPAQLQDDAGVAAPERGTSTGTTGPPVLVPPSSPRDLSKNPPPQTHTVPPDPPTTPLSRIFSDDSRTRQRFRRRPGRLRDRIRRYVADVEYMIRQPLGTKEGVLLTWAGLRGVVTLAAAQTLPIYVAHRSLLLLTAFIVAAGSLLIQGGTLSAVAKGLGLQGKDVVGPGEAENLERDLAESSLDFLWQEGLVQPNGKPFDTGIVAVVRERAGTRLSAVGGKDRRSSREHADQADAAVADTAMGAVAKVIAPAGGAGPPASASTLTTTEKMRQVRLLRLQMIRAERATLLEARSMGAYSFETLLHALATLDADEISLQIRVDPEGG